MSSGYDEFADQYDQTFKLLPYRPYIEAHSVFKLLGDVQGQSVLELASGTGFYSRELRRRGAGPVHGVDLSEEMVGMARTIESQEELGITYDVQDVGSLNKLGDFDLVLAVYLLHYASDRDHLRRMCEGIAANLRTGQRFVTYQLNPDFQRSTTYYSKYGLNLNIPETLDDGQPFTFSVTVGDVTSPEFTVYYWGREALEGALREAGFTDIRWVAPEVSEAGRAHHDDAYWHEYLTTPHCMLIEAVRGPAPSFSAS